MPEIRNTRLRSLLISTAWVLLGFEIVLAIAVTGITGSAASGFRNALQCSVPDKLNYNLAIAIITFIVLPILAFVSRRYDGANWRPMWWIGIFVVFVVLWAAALGSSFYTCSDLCSACAQPFPIMITYAGKCCDCAGVDGLAEDFCSDSSSTSLISFERIHHWYLATQSLDGVILAFMTFSAIIVAMLSRVMNAPTTVRGESTAMNDFPTRKAAGETIERNDEPPAYQA